MLFQPFLNGTAPFIVSRRTLSDFTVHLHHEIEIIYCLDGSADFTAGGKNYSLKTGQAILINSMVPHTYHAAFDTQILLIELGPIFLKQHFAHFTNLKLNAHLFSFAGQDEPVHRILDGIAAECDAEDIFAPLHLTGDLYNLCAAVLEALQNQQEENHITHTLNIEKALQLVHSQYDKDISLEEAAAVTNYGKSNFCRIFKNVVGVSFHKYLNEFRLKNAEYLLTATAEPVSKIAEMVGYRDSKTFCRSFKSQFGVSPGEYRTGNPQER